MTAALYRRGSGSLIGGAAAHWFIGFPGGLGRAANGAVLQTPPWLPAYIFQHWGEEGGFISSRYRCPLCEPSTLWCSIKRNLTAFFPFFLLLRSPLKEGGQRGTEREEYMKGRAGEGKVTTETVRLRSEFTQVNGSFFKSISLCLCALWFRRGSFHCLELSCLSSYEPCEPVACDRLSWEEAGSSASEERGENINTPTENEVLKRAPVDTLRCTTVHGEARARCSGLTGTNCIM